MRCFLDFEPGGSLCHIFAGLYRHKNEQRWKNFNFDVTKASRKVIESNIQMGANILQTLVNNNHFRLPYTYIRPEVDEILRQEITNILEKRKCEITTDESQASHIIYPKIDTLLEDYARPLFKRKKNIMIHWYYLPASYDSYVANTFNLPVSN